MRHLSRTPVPAALLLILGSVFHAGCQSPESPEAEPAGAPESEPAAPRSESHPAAETGAPMREAPPPEIFNEDLAPIPIELPKPVFAGTPPSLKFGKHVEKPLGRPRPPFLAPKGTANVGLEKPVSGSDEEPIIGELAMVADGDKEGTDGSFVELGPGLQYVQIDLEAVYEIYAILVWHYHMEPRVYHDVVVQVSDDPDFITGVKTVFNNDYDNSSGLGLGRGLERIETNEGKLIDAKCVKGRYVRLYSNGNTSNDLNHYVEVEVYSKPVE